jgi:hypothetical protein
MDNITKVQIQEAIRTRVTDGLSYQQIESEFIDAGYTKEQIQSFYTEVTNADKQLNSASNHTLTTNSLSEDTINYGDSSHNRKLVILAATIAVLLFFGLINLNSLGIGIFLLLFNPAVLVNIPVAVVLAGLIFFIVKQFKRTVQDGFGVYVPFLYSVSFYFLISVLLFWIAGRILTLQVSSVPSDTQFAVGLVGSIFLTSVIPFVYIGLLVLMGVLIRSTRNLQGHVQDKNNKISLIIISAASLLALYLFSAIAPLASLLNSQSLCSFVYNTEIKRNCLVNALPISQTSDSTTDQQDFVIVETDYSNISDLKEINGKLAYKFEVGGTSIAKSSDQSGILYDGEVISSVYEKVGHRPIADINDKIAYEAYKGDRRVIVWNGQEYGLEYDDAFDPLEIGGTLAYYAFKTDEGGDRKTILIHNGIEYHGVLDEVESVGEINGIPILGGSGNRYGYVVQGSQEYGPYSSIPHVQVKDGNYWAEVRSYQVEPYGDREFRDLYLVNGEEVAVNLEGYIEQATFIEDTFTYSFRRDDRHYIMFGDEFIGEAYADVDGPFDVNGKLGYLAIMTDGTSQMIVDGVPTGPVFNDKVMVIRVSDGGQIAVLVGDTDEYYLGNSVYLDGEEVFSGTSAGMLFVDENLLFQTENGFWYNGQIILEDTPMQFSDYTHVDGRLHMVGMVSDTRNGTRTHYLISEQ